MTRTSRTANGQFKLELLRDGWYRVTELEPAAGFTIKEPATQEVYIKGGENKVLTFENVPLNAIAVEKYDSVTGEALPGCTFQLRYLAGASGTGGNVIGTKVTGKNGTALWTGLKPGTYILEEIDPADGYSIIQSSETILLADSGEQSVVTVRFTNSPDGMLLIRKVCSVNPSVTLQDAEFKVLYADGSVVGDSNGIFRTDENGEIRITGLKPGKSVVVTETRAPAGFILDTQSQTVQVKEGKTVSLTFKNQPKGGIIVQKRDSDTNEPLPGAEFRITTAAGCEVGLDGVIGSSSLNAQAIPYSKPDKPWNKNMVARILSNEVYTGSESYPAILSAEEYRRAVSAKPIFDTASGADRKAIRQLARCAVCGKTLVLSANRHGWARWNCPSCNAISAGAVMPDTVGSLTRILAAVIRHPEMIQEPSSKCFTSSGIEQMEQDLNITISVEIFDEPAAKAKALSLAAARFAALGSEDYETMRIQYILARAEQSDGLDIALLRQITSAILIHTDGAVSLKLKNGQILERRDLP